MRVTMRTIACGPSLTAVPGQTVDVPPEVGRDLVAGGYAVDCTPAAKTAAKSAPAKEPASGAETEDSADKPPARTGRRKKAASDSGE